MIRQALTFMLLFAVVVFAPNVLFGADCDEGSACSILEEYFDDTEHGSGWVNNVLDATTYAQKFIAREDFEICKVDVYISSRGGFSDVVTVYVQDAEPGGAYTVQTSGTFNTDGDADEKWYCADVDDMQLNMNTAYWIVVVGSISGNNWWHFDWRISGDPYENGEGYPDLPYINYDFLFRTYSKVELYHGSEDGGKNPVTFTVTSGKIAPSTTVTLTASSGTLQLIKGAEWASVSLSNATAVVQFGEELVEDLWNEDSTVLLGTRKCSDFVITSLSGQFAPYNFGSDYVGTSDFSLISSGQGRIVWEKDMGAGVEYTRSLIAHVRFRIEADDYGDIYANAFGSGEMNSDSTQITLMSDAGCSQISFGGPRVPAIGILGLAVVAAIMLVIGWYFIRRRRFRRAGSGVA